METDKTLKKEFQCNDKSQHDKNVKIITDAIPNILYKEC